MQDTTPTSPQRQEAHQDCLENIALGVHIRPDGGQHPAPPVSDQFPDEVPAWLRFMAENIAHWHHDPQAGVALADWAWRERIPDAIMQTVAEDMAASLRWTRTSWTDGRRQYVNLYLAARGWARTAMRFAHRTAGGNNGRPFRY